MVVEEADSVLVVGQRCDDEGGGGSYHDAHCHGGYDVFDLQYDCCEHYDDQTYDFEVHSYGFEVHSYDSVAH